MSEPPPEPTERGPVPESQPLDYATRPERARKGRSPEDKREFRVGFLGGCICSLIVWSLAFSGVLGEATAFVAFGFVIAKFAVVTVLLWIPGGTRMALGILLSIGIVSLILMGTCFAMISQSGMH